MRWIVGFLAVVALAAIAITSIATRSREDHRLVPVSPGSESSADIDGEAASAHADEVNANAPTVLSESTPSRAPVLRKVVRSSNASGTVRGRGVDEAGAALDLVRARACLEYFRLDAHGNAISSGDPLPLALVSETDGRFHVDIPGSSLVDAHRRIVLLLGVQKGASPWDRSLRGWVEVPGDLSAVPDVGDVALVRAPPLLEGYVVDELGVRVASAVLRVVEEPDEAARDALRFGPLPATSSDVSGHFELRGWTDADKLSLSVTSGRHEPRRLDDIEPHARNLKIVLALPHHAAISGRVLVDDESLISRLSVGIPNTPGGEQLPLRNLENPSANKATPGTPFSFWIRPGDCTLEVHVDSGNALVEKIEHILAIEGNSNLDDRINPIDLRGKLQWLEATLHDRNGAPYRWSVQLEIEGAAPLSVRPTENGVVRVLSVVNGAKWFVRPAGGEPIELVHGRTIVMPGN